MSFEIPDPQSLSAKAFPNLAQKSISEKEI